MQVQRVAHLQRDWIPRRHPLASGRLSLPGLAHRLCLFSQRNQVIRKGIQPSGSIRKISSNRQNKRKNEWYSSNGLNYSNPNKITLRPITERLKKKDENNIFKMWDMCRRSGCLRKIHWYRKDKVKKYIFNIRLISFFRFLIFGQCGFTD